jgi:hypothetical protein
MFHRYNGKHAVTRAIKSLSVRARIGIVTGTIAALSVAALMLPTSASASSTYCRAGSAWGSCPIYAGPYTGYYVSEIPNGTSVHMLCWTDTQWADINYWSPRWFKVSTVYGTWWMHSSEVYSQTSVGHC